MSIRAALLLVLALVPAQVDAAWVQTNGSAEPGSDPNVEHKFSNNTTPANLLVCAVAWAPTATAISSVGDGTNTWTQVATNSPIDISSGTFGMAMYYSQNVAGGSTTVTVTWGAAVSNKVLICGEWSGIATASAFDVSVGQPLPTPGNGDDAVTSGTSAAATSQANDLVVAIALVRSTVISWSPGSAGDLRGMAVADGGGFYEMQVEDRNLATATTFAGAFTINIATGDAGVIAAAFKAGGSPPAGRLLLLGVGQ